MGLKYAVLDDGDVAVGSLSDDIAAVEDTFAASEGLRFLCSHDVRNFDTPMDIHSNDEIGQLASTLEYMASELEKLDDYRKAFISNISHDFRSPLTSIKGYIEAIQDGTIPPEKQSHYLDIVVQQTNRLTKLTSSLLELNNYDSYGIWLVCKDFDIVELVLSAINSFEGR